MLSGFTGRGSYSSFFAFVSGWSLPLDSFHSFLRPVALNIRLVIYHDDVLIISRSQEEIKMARDILMCARKNLKNKVLVPTMVIELLRVNRVTYKTQESGCFVTTLSFKSVQSY